MKSQKKITCYGRTGKDTAGCGPGGFISNVSLRLRRKSEASSLPVKASGPEGVSSLAPEILEWIHQATECLLIYLHDYDSLAEEVRKNSPPLVMGIAGHLTKHIFLKVPGDIVADAFSASVVLQNFFREEDHNERLRAVGHLQAVRNRLQLDHLFGKVRGPHNGSEGRSDH